MVLFSVTHSKTTRAVLCLLLLSLSSVLVCDGRKMTSAWLFSVRFFSRQDVIFPGQNSGSSPYLSTYYKVPTTHMQNSLLLNTYFPDVRCSPM